MNWRIGYASCADARRDRWMDTSDLCSCWRIEAFVKMLFYLQNLTKTSLVLSFCSKALKVEQCREAESVHAAWNRPLEQSAECVSTIHCSLNIYCYYFLFLLEFFLHFCNKCAITPGPVCARLHTTEFGNILLFFSNYFYLNGSIGDRRQWWKEQTWFMGAVFFTVRPKILKNIYDFTFIY